MTRYIEKLINILMSITLLLKKTKSINYLSNNIAKP